MKTLDAYFKAVPKQASRQEAENPKSQQPTANHRERSNAGDVARAPLQPPPPPRLAPRQAPAHQSRPPPMRVDLRAGASKDEILAAMLHGRKILPTPSNDGPAVSTHGDVAGAGSSARPAAARLHLNLSRGTIVAAADDPRERAAPLQRPSKRPCLCPQAPCSPSSTSTAPPPERSGSLLRILQARSCGRVPPRRELWTDARRPLSQAECWDAALRFRPPSVVQQDAVTQIDVSAADGAANARLAVAQANQAVRIVPYSVLRDLVEARRAANLEAAEALERGGSDDDDGGDAAGDDDNGIGSSRGPVRQQGHPRHRQNPRRHRPQGTVVPWEDLSSSSAARYHGPRNVNGGGSSAVLTLRTHQHVAALGWDPRRTGRLALVDRSSPNVMLLDLGAGGAAAGGQGPGFTRSYLTAAPATSAGALGAVGGGPGGGGSGAARALTYLRYGSLSAPYTLAAAGRASGEGAVVHLWDERRGKSPVSRLTCPGGAPLVTPLEASVDGTALLGVVHPGTLVVWDVRRASSTAAGGAVFSLGSSAPCPSAVVAAVDLLAPLAAAGCWRPVVSSLCCDPRDTGRLAVLTQDGSSALWDLRAASVTFACPAAPPPAATAPLAPLEPASAAAVAAPMATVPGASSPAGTGAAAVPSLTAAAVCGMAGALYGTWDADVCCFWHPAPLNRFPGNGAQPDAGPAGGAVGAASASSVGPGFQMADFRMNHGSAATAASALAAAASGSGSDAAPSVIRPAALTAASAGGSLASGAAVPVWGGGAGLSGTHVGSTVPLQDWPVCVACVPYSGDLVVGTLGGQLSYWLKS